MIDPRIPMGFQPGQQPSLLDIEQQAAQVQAQRAQPALQAQQFALNDQRLQAGQMELDQGRRQIEEQKRKEAGLSELSKLWAQHGDDDNAIVAGLNQGGFADVAQAYTSNRAKMREDAFTAEEKRLKNQAEQIKLLGGIAGTIKDEASYQRGIGQALASGLLDARGAAEWLGRPWTPETQAAVAQLAQQSLTAQQQAELQIKQAEDARKALFDAANLDKTKAEAKMKGLEAEGKAPIQPADMMTADTKEYELAKQQGFKGSFAEWTSRQANLKAPRTTVVAGGGGSGSSGLVDAVLANPALFENLTPTAKTAIAPELAKRGFTGFGARAGEGEINRIADVQESISGVDSLLAKLPSNRGLFGPMVGRTGAAGAAMGMNDAAAAMRAEVDLLRQRVGKALEGGVLRKEDEAKYKKILPELTDPPAVAETKLRQLRASLTRDLANFQQTAAQAGRRPISAGAGAPKDPLGIR